MCGIKGEPHLTVFPYFDCSKGVIIDEMHAIFEGAVKKIVSMWYSILTEQQVNFQSHSVSCRTVSCNLNFLDIFQREAINLRICGTKAPSCISRSPRDIFDKKIKANEFRNFLFYYAVPCCKGVVPENYVNHFALLVEAVSLLSKVKILVVNDIPRARAYLQKFCNEFAGLYGQHLI